MDTLLVGVDGSDAAAAALRWAIDLAVGVRSKRLLVACVYIADPVDVRSWDDAHELARAELEAWCAPVREAGVPYEALLLDGEPGAALMAAADDHDADLCVISRRGRGGLDAVMAGSTADYVAHHTSRPLAVMAPGVPSTSPPRHLVVGIDGSMNSAAAATWAGQLASRVEAAVTAAFVPVMPHVIGKITGVGRDGAEEALSGLWTAPIRDAGITPDCRVLDGHHPADALMKLAIEVGADAIVSGTRSVGGLRFVRLGGVTMELLHSGPVPVIIVPPSA